MCDMVARMRALRGFLAAAVLSHDPALDQILRSLNRCLIRLTAR